MPLSARSCRDLLDEQRFVSMSMRRLPGGTHSPLMPKGAQPKLGRFSRRQVRKRCPVLAHRRRVRPQGSGDRSVHREQLTQMFGSKRAVLPEGAPGALEGSMPYVVLYSSV